jgi:tetratricopeptide (TPR) repeat protein
MRLLQLLLALLLLAGAARAQDAGADAYRAGDYDTATTLWQDALSVAEAPPERARLCYNLGNAAYRRGERLEAIGWYVACLRLAPRHARAWANLELARAEEELPPADSGNLEDTLARAVSALTRGEAEWLALAALALLALCLLGEALRGGAWRGASLLVLCTLCVALVPLGWHLTRDDGRTLLVVRAGGAPARSEPRPDAKRLFDLAAGAEVRHLDALPGWVKVEGQGRREVWVREDALFDLQR